MQDVAGERGGYLHGRGALDSDDLLYLKEQMEAEEDAERLRRRTEKRAFAAFRRAANLADASVSSAPPVLRVEPKARSEIRQQVLLKNILAIKPKRQCMMIGTNSEMEGVKTCKSGSDENVVSGISKKRLDAVSRDSVVDSVVPSDQARNGSGLLGLSYDSSEDESE